MKSKINSRFDERLPLFIRKKNNIIYYQLQIEIAKEDGNCAGMYCEYAKIDETKPTSEIGGLTLKLLDRFHAIADLTVDEFIKLKGMTVEQYKVIKQAERHTFMNAKSSEDLDFNYKECTIDYNLETDRYSFGLSWITRRGRQKYIDFSPSTGEPGVLTYKESLEFDIDVDPEVLGKMVLEAFDRSQQLEEICSSGFQPPKLVELNSEDGNRKVSVNPSKDPHFYDEEDGGVGEIYQVYTYYAHEGDEPSAYFALGIAPYIFNGFTPEVIKKAWEGYDGKAEYFDHKQISLGIFTRRAEMRNKKVHRISYYIQFEDKEILECEYCLYLPNRRKKLDEKLSSLFEKYALECKLVNN